VILRIPGLNFRGMVSPSRLGFHENTMMQQGETIQTWRTKRGSIVLADNQAIFRAGASRVISAENDLEVLIQCSDHEQLLEAIRTCPNSIVVFPSKLAPDLVEMFQLIERHQSRPVMILEHGEDLDETVSWRAAGIIHRSVTGPQLIDCLRTVASGERSVHRAVVKTMPNPDRTGDRVLQRLTPKEMQIVALVGEGCKNKEIASRLGTKEQVIKNYLRTIYDKTGVSDRLELALFTLHHRALAEAAEQVRAQFARSA
jgi:DNA-binding NarL/FixJ family response regulator